ncbi:MAG TPA: nucleoside triphosphate pyrophosphohydrolase [Anaerolineaceae bacterium]
MKGITILGLGPGNPGQITREAWEWLQGCGEVYLRTRKHPVVQSLPPDLVIHSFDEYYDQGSSFEEVYDKIIQSILQEGLRGQGVTYAVPGHPFIAEVTGPEIYRRAKDMGIPVRIIAGVSFLEVVFTALGLDPFPQISLVDALEIAARQHPPFPADQPALIAQVYNRQVAAEVKLVLNRVYPDLHPVRLVHGAGTAEEVVENLSLYEIDRSRKTDLLTSLYIPPLGLGSSLQAFQDVVARLRAPDGCPWDREQTRQSLRPYILEETYEVVSAIDEDNLPDLKEELGDLLLQIVLQAQIATEENEFTLEEVIQGIQEKIVRRHPHVFGDVQVADVAGVLNNWEKLKDKERGEKPQKSKGILDSVPKALPALVQAQQYQSRAGHVHLDWSEGHDLSRRIVDIVSGMSRKESLAYENPSELGDLLFAVVDLIRRQKMDAESVLREANLRFARRIQEVETLARQQEKSLADLSQDEIRQLWINSAGNAK